MDAQLKALQAPLKSRYREELDADASANDLANLVKLTERYCVVYQTLRAGPPIDVSYAAEGACHLYRSEHCGGADRASIDGMTNDLLDHRRQGLLFQRHRCAPQAFVAA